LSFAFVPTLPYHVPPLGMTPPRGGGVPNGAFTVLARPLVDIVNRFNEPRAVHGGMLSLTATLSLNMTRFNGLAKCAAGGE
jgi:hypothetical protein